MTNNPSSTSTPSWLYFLSGALLPTLAFLLSRKISTNKDNKESERNYDSDEDDEDFERLTNTQTAAQWGMQDAPYKMILCVNKELKMGNGKIAAQCCHAAVGCYKSAQKHSPNGLRAWEYTGCAKVAVKVPKEEEMIQIMNVARDRGIPFYLVCDAGRTQIAAGSRTVLGLGPAPVYMFDSVTDHLKLM